jgi:tRNA(fMet)-specific endonuclease VapC
MKYLLDTNIVSAIIRDPHGPAAKRFLERGMEQTCTTIIVAAELRFGAVRRSSHLLMQKLDAFFKLLPILPLEPPAEQFYANLRAELERAGKPIGANDMFIAAHALALGCTLVTDNEREFSRVKGLAVENWLH